MTSFQKNIGYFPFLPYGVSVDIVKVHHMGSEEVATVRGLSMRLTSRVSYPEPSGLNLGHFYSAIML